ncbi:MAG: hypothetical protein AAF674_03615, partial [Pseudomonadota bacterium]
KRAPWRNEEEENRKPNIKSTTEKKTSLLRWPKIMQQQSENRVLQGFHFCEVNFNLDLPMTTITKVRGSKAHPFYLWARDAFGRNKAPGWNFHKYLIGPDGQPVASFHSGQRPMSRPVVQAVEALLAPDT